MSVRKPGNLPFNASSCNGHNGGYHLPKTKQGVPFFSERLKLQRVENTLVRMYFKTISTFIGQGLPRTQHPFTPGGSFYLPSCDDTSIDVSFNMRIPQSRPLDTLNLVSRDASPIRSQLQTS